MNRPCYYRVSVKALITDETGKFLLARESDGVWDMLGGGLEHTEDPTAALRREIQEEAGIEVTAADPSPKYFVTAFKPANNVYLANVVYAVKIKGVQFTPSDECQELRYFTVEEARNVPLQPNVEKLLELLA